MKEKKTKKTSAKKPVLERWTVDRIDRDAGMARIEAVPMHPGKLTDKLLKKLSKKGLEMELEDLSLWNPKKVKIHRMEIKLLESKLGFRDEEKETLSENMVFWVVNPDRKRKKDPVYHATRAAREVAKNLYEQVSRRERSTS